MSTDLALTKKSLTIDVIPEQGKSQYELDIAPMYYALARADKDSANVNSHTAAELLSVVVNGYNKTSQIVAAIQRQLRRAELELDKIQAQLIIDDFPGWLEQHPKMGNNKEIRDSFVNANPRLNEVKELIINLKAWVKFFEGKQRSLEMYHSSIKRTVDNTNYGIVGQAMDIGDRIEDYKVAGTTQDDPLFGTPKYRR